MMFDTYDNNPLFVEVFVHVDNCLACKQCPTIQEMVTEYIILSVFPQAYQYVVIGNDCTNVEELMNNFRTDITNRAYLVHYV